MKMSELVGKLVKNKVYSDEELLKDVKRVKKELGKMPSVREYAKLGKYHFQTLIYRFKSWENVKYLCSGIEEKADKIYELIKNEGPITVAEIAKRLKISGVEVRKIVGKVLIIGRRIPIGSKLKGEKKGFYLIQNREDLEREIRTLQSRIMHIAQRVAVLKQIEAWEFLEQLAFDWRFGRIEEEEYEEEG